MNRTQKKHFNTGKGLVQRNPSVADYARRATVDSMCLGEFDTPYYRALANKFVDFQEGKITREEWEGISQNTKKS